jgi:hypothetical protein
MEMSELLSYFKGEKQHYYYKKAVEQAKDLGIHINGEYPGELIEERRPSESVFIKDYRKKIWVPITEETMSQVLTELQKIRKADDWSVRYDVTKFSRMVVEDEQPNEYFEENFPQFKSVTNWAFAVLLQLYAQDANAVMLVLPLEKTEVTTYRRPFPFLFESDQVYEFRAGEFTVLKSKEKYIYTSESGVKGEGDIFYVVDKEEFVKYVQINAKGDFEVEEQYPHNLGYLPAYQLGGAVKKQKGRSFLWKSRLSAMLPRLKEAVREYSDIQAEVVQHVHSEKWVIETQNCTLCKGSGKTRQGNPVEIVDCPQCKGSGTVSTSPYSNMVVNPGKIGEQNVPIPPAGYIQKQVEIVKIQDERIDKHVYRALCAINMQYLDKTPLSESGIAKEVDKDALNNFVNAVAEDIVAIMDKFYECAIDMRYMDIVPDAKKREEMCPKIAVPTKLDVLSAGYLVDEVDRLKKANVNPIIVTATEIELANKKFNNDPTVRDMLVCVYEMDPLGGFSQDDKMTMLQNKGITHEDFVISCNIQRLVKQAYKQDANFFKLDFDSKLKKLQELAKPIIEATEPKVDTTNPEPAV